MLLFFGGCANVSRQGGWYTPRADDPRQRQLLVSPDGRRATVRFVDTTGRARFYRTIVDLATTSAELTADPDGLPVAFAPDDVIWVERDGERPGGRPPELRAFDRSGREVPPIDGLRGFLFRSVAVSQREGDPPSLRELTTGQTIALSAGWTEAGLLRSQAARRYRSGSRRVISGCTAASADRVTVRWLDVDQAFAAKRDTTRGHELTLTRPGMRGECAVSAEGTAVAILAEDGSFSIYRVADGRELTHQAGRFAQLAFAGDDTLVAAGDGGLTIVVFAEVTQVRRHDDPLGELSAAGPVVLWRSRLAPGQPPPPFADRAPVGHLFAAAGRQRKLLADEFKLADALGGRVDLIDRFARWQPLGAVEEAAVVAPERAVFFGRYFRVLWILDAGGRRITVPMPSLPAWRS